MIGKKSNILGLLILLIVLCVVASMFGSGFLTPFNAMNLLQRTALFSILGIGAGLVIATGGIDLSIGSIVCLAGVLTPWLLVDHEWSPWLVVPLVLLGTACLGLGHGLLITRLRLQPFLVTLCGLLLYRGLARWITGDSSQGFMGEYADLRAAALFRIPLPGVESFRLPITAVEVGILAVLVAFVLSRTVWGRWVLATGSNEGAARYSGLPTASLVSSAYVGCALLAGAGGMLFIFDIGSAQPSDFGNFYELYAIAAAVLGGCSLRGGTISIAGIVIATAVLQVLRNSIIILGLGSELEFAVIGGVLLIGVAADELVRRVGRG